MSQRSAEPALPSLSVACVPFAWCDCWYTQLGLCAPHLGELQHQLLYQLQVVHEKGSVEPAPVRCQGECQGEGIISCVWIGKGVCTGGVVG